MRAFPTASKNPTNMRTHSAVGGRTHRVLVLNNRSFVMRRRHVNERPRDPHTHKPLRTHAPRPTRRALNTRYNGRCVRTCIMRTLGGPDLIGERVSEMSVGNVRAYKCGTYTPLCGPSEIKSATNISCRRCPAHKRAIVRRIYYIRARLGRLYVWRLHNWRC